MIYSKQQLLVKGSSKVWGLWSILASLPEPVELCSKWDKQRAFHQIFDIKSETQFRSFISGAKNEVKTDMRIGKPSLMSRAVLLLSYSTSNHLSPSAQLQPSPPSGAQLSKNSRPGTPQLPKASSTAPPSAPCHSTEPSCWCPAKPGTEGHPWREGPTRRSTAWNSPFPWRRRFFEGFWCIQSQASRGRWIESSMLWHLDTDMHVIGWLDTQRLVGCLHLPCTGWWVKKSYFMRTTAGSSCLMLSIVWGRSCTITFPGAFGNLLWKDSASWPSPPAISISRVD